MEDEKGQSLFLRAKLTTLSSAFSTLQVLHRGRSASLDYHSPMSSWELWQDVGSDEAAIDRNRQGPMCWREKGDMTQRETQPNPREVDQSLDNGVRLKLKNALGSVKRSSCNIFVVIRKSLVPSYSLFSVSLVIAGFVCCESSTT